MTKCIVCGRVLKSDISIARGVGSECVKKFKRSGSVSGSKNRWSAKVSRTVALARGEPIGFGKTVYTSYDTPSGIGDGETRRFWKDGENLDIDEHSFTYWLEKNRLFIVPQEVSDILFRKLMVDGNTLDEVVAFAIKYEFALHACWSESQRNKKLAEQKLVCLLE